MRARFYALALAATASAATADGPQLPNSIVVALDSCQLTVATRRTGTIATTDGDGLLLGCEKKGTSLYCGVGSMGGSQMANGETTILDASGVVGQEFRYSNFRHGTLIILDAATRRSSYVSRVEGPTGEYLGAKVCSGVFAPLDARPKS